MTPAKRTVHKAIQGLLGATKRQRQQRRKYKYYEGHQRLSLALSGAALQLEAETSLPVRSISVLHGESIIATFEVEDSPAVSGHRATVQIQMATLLDAWDAYASTSEQETSLVEDRGTSPTVNDDGLPMGTVRLALVQTATTDALPNGVALMQADPGDAPLRRKEFINRFLPAAEDGQEQPAPAQVIVHRVLGRFAETEINVGDGYKADGRQAVPYVNKNSEVSIALNRPLGHAHQLRTDRIDVAHGVLTLAGVIDTKSDTVSGARLIAVGRRSHSEFSAIAELELDHQMAVRRFGRRLYSWNARLDFSAQDWGLIDSRDNYDLYLALQVNGEPEEIRQRIGRTPYLVRRTTSGGTLIRDEKTLAISPYYTFKAKATSLILEIFDRDAFAVLTDARARTFPHLTAGNAPVWIIGELPYKAQDNGLHLFRYLRAHRPDIDAYYVIDEDSPDLRNFDSMDHVVFHGSKRHFQLALEASRFIGSHHPDYLYPTRYQGFSTRSRATRVFLQHGVMGTKWMVPNYGKESPGFTTDLFFVSSDREKQYIVQDFGYDEEEVKVTGLPRFDSLLSGDIPIDSKMILVIPTWRDWLQAEDGFLESEYFEQWHAFLASEKLARMKTEHGLEITFSLHPNMQHLRHYFDDVPARVIIQGEVDVQELIKRAAVMVTDYSSVGFDFSFLHKPVHYFQFDRPRFLGRFGSHLDLDAELPGAIAVTSDQLLDDLELTVRRGMVMERKYVARADVFMTHRDRNNAARVTSSIENAALRKRPDNPWSGELHQLGMQRFRKHKYYFSLMRGMYRAVRALPADENLIVFESGLGKQYGDSPRYIYEELLRRGDTTTKVWVYSGPHKFTDPSTRMVRRLSPEYYWYLARAKYWVSNQSMPHYIRARKDGIFLQTWHGTPLKQMALDITEVQGRDEGYLDRVLAATNQWSHLVSPSPYTTAALRSAYGFTGPAVEIGYPRNDIMVAPGREAREAVIRDALSLDPSKSTVLYAPTFRDDAGNGRGKFQFQLPMDLSEFDRRFGSDTVLLLRMHMLVSNSLEIPEELAGRVINVSSYPDIQELYLVSDVLITDYSSVFFDYALLGRPVIFYAFDLENYRDNLRGFYVDYDRDLPGPVVETEEELWDTLERALSGEDIGGVDRASFLARFAPRDDGFASQRVVDQFFAGRGVDKSGDSNSA